MYGVLDRLTSATGTGGAGSYTYGDSSHLHGVTSTSGGYGAYSASYDAAGDMTCRSLTSATTCAGSTPTGQKLSYDSEGRLTGWQNASSNPTSTATDAYDGEGQRVAQRVTSGGTTTTTDYIAGGLEEQTGSTLTKYETVPGVIAVVIVGTGSSETVSYLATDGLGSVSEAFDGRGHVLGAQLYGPFGGIRYSSGTMPTARGYTGQYADAASSGLDYYGARYYDPVVGQFTSADTLLDGLNRYAYVGNNPETRTDPTGHDWWNDPSIVNGFLLALDLLLNLYGFPARDLAQGQFPQNIQQILEQVGEPLDNNGAPSNIPTTGPDNYGGSNTPENTPGTPQNSQKTLDRLFALSNPCNPEIDPNCPDGPNGGASQALRRLSRQSIPPSGTQHLPNHNGGTGTNPFNHKKSETDHLGSPQVQRMIEGNASFGGIGGNGQIALTPQALRLIDQNGGNQRSTSDGSASDWPGGNTPGLCACGSGTLPIPGIGNPTRSSAPSGISPATNKPDIPDIPSFLDPAAWIVGSFRVW